MVFFLIVEILTKDFLYNFISWKLDKKRYIKEFNHGKTKTIQYIFRYFIKTTVKN